jgi:CRP/FNR family transcriptional regulator
MPCNSRDCPFYRSATEGGPFAEPEARCLVDDVAQKVSFEQGDVLFRQGQTSASLYSIAAGAVKICSNSADGREKIVGLSTDGNMLVGLQSISDKKYAYTAIAATAIQGCKINHKSLLALAKDSGDLGMRVIRAMNNQLAHSRALMEVMGQKSAAAKIAAFILLMAPAKKHCECRFSLPFSRRDIAGLFGLSEETVCRLMADMRRAGAIYAPRGRIEIRDWQQLQAIADGDSRDCLAA